MTKNIDVSKLDLSESIVNIRRVTKVVKGGKNSRFSVTVVVGDREFTLEAGDSIYFNPEKPHGQRAVTETAKFLTIINE